MFIFALSNTILLRCIYIGGLMINPFFSKKKKKKLPRVVLKYLRIKQAKSSNVKIVIVEGERPLHSFEKYNNQFQSLQHAMQGIVQMEYRYFHPN
jgi:hypothetical protein